MSFRKASSPGQLGQIVVKRMGLAVAIGDQTNATFPFEIILLVAEPRVAIRLSVCDAANN